MPQFTFIACVHDNCPSASPHPGIARSAFCGIATVRSSRLVARNAMPWSSLVDIAGCSVTWSLVKDSVYHTGGMEGNTTPIYCRHEINA